MVQNRAHGVKILNWSDSYTLSRHWVIFINIWLMQNPLPWPPAFLISRALPNWEESPRGMFSDVENWNQIHMLMNLLCQAIPRPHRPRARFQTQGLLRLFKLAAAKPGSSGSSHGPLWTPWSGIWSLPWPIWVGPASSPTTMDTVIRTPWDSLPLGSSQGLL